MPVVPTHPVTTPDPDVLRWVVPDGLLPFTGEVARAPALLQALIDDGTLSSVRVDGGAVLTLLGPDRSWRQEGARVRSALVDALGAPGSWEGGQAAHASGPDDALESAARQIASGSLGSFVNSHGGSLMVRSVRDGVVEISMEGACDDCPAAEITMHARFEHLVAAPGPPLLRRAACPSPSRAEVAQPHRCLLGFATFTGFKAVGLAVRRGQGRGDQSDGERRKIDLSRVRETTIA